MQVIDILTNKPYQVIIKPDIFAEIPSIIKDKYNECKICIITDDIVFGLYSNELNSRLNSEGVNSDVYVIDHGESGKSMANYSNLLNFLADNDFTRSDIIIAVGGGVVGDLAGFVAASYMRGIRFIQLPTTLLAAIDSSVGGKTAINLDKGKNMVGAFHQPIACYIDPHLLSTLPDNEWQCGIGEGLKYAILEGGRIYDIMAEGSCLDNITEFIELAVKAKAKYVAQDEFDRGARMLLNLGHSYGHSIETSTNYSLPHGMAVAEGLRYSLDISIKLNIFKGANNSVEQLLNHYNIPNQLYYSRLNKYLTHDKKAEGSMLNLIVIEDIGKCRVHKISIRDIINITE